MRRKGNGLYDSKIRNGNQRAPNVFGGDLPMSSKYKSNSKREGILRVHLRDQKEAIALPVSKGGVKTIKELLEGRTEQGEIQNASFILERDPNEEVSHGSKSSEGHQQTGGNPGEHLMEGESRGEGNNNLSMDFSGNKFEINPFRMGETEFGNGGQGFGIGLTLPPLEEALRPGEIKNPFGVRTEDLNAPKITPTEEEHHGSAEGNEGEGESEEEYAFESQKDENYFYSIIPQDFIKERPEIFRALNNYFDKENDD